MAYFFWVHNDDVFLSFRGVGLEDDFGELFAHGDRWWEEI